MSTEAQSRNSVLGLAWNSVFALIIVLLILMVVISFVVLTAQPAQAQTFQVIYNFTGGVDGESPSTGLTVDRVNNFYGTTFGRSDRQCDTLGCGTVFKLSRRNQGWVLTTLYSFKGVYGLQIDGSNPLGRVAVAADGSLYGTTYYGGGPQSCVYLGLTGCGTIFHLRPLPEAPRSAVSPWGETVIHRFTGGFDGGSPQGDLVFDSAGHIIGTAMNGGPTYTGVVYELTSFGSSWTFIPIYAPSYYGDQGTTPSGGVTFDAAGNLYGVLSGGGSECNGAYYCGAIYELLPTESGWTAETIHIFNGRDGSNPMGGLISDGSGTLYGTTPGGVSGGGGTAFSLTPAQNDWIVNTINTFYSSDYLGGPQEKLVMDTAGNLYGTTFRQGSHDLGTVFKLTRSQSGWAYSLLHDFTGGTDGAWPRALVMGSNGHLYGTASAGGTGTACDYGCGVVFEMMP